MDFETYQAVLRNSPTGYSFHKVIYNDQGQAVDYEFLDVNKTFESIIGLRAEEIIGRKATDILGEFPVGAAHWIDCFGEMAAHEGRTDFSFFAKELNLWYRVNAYAPKKGYFITHFSDVSKEVQHIRELDTIFKVTPDLLCVLNYQGNFMKTNRAWEDLLGYQNDTLMGDRFLDYIHPEEVIDVGNNLGALLVNGRQVTFIARFRHQKGHYHHLDWRCYSYGQNIYMAARDISDELEEDRITAILVRCSQEFLQMTVGDVDYQRIAAYLQEIAGAKYVNFNLLDPLSGQYETVALVGSTEDREKLKGALGCDPVGHQWQLDDGPPGETDDGVLRIFPSACEMWARVLPKNIVRRLSREFPSGEGVWVKILKDGQVAGNFVLAMPVGKPCKNKGAVEIFARQVGSLLARIQAEKEVSNQKAYFEALFLNTSDAMIYFDEDGRAFKTNQQFTELFGYELDELAGRNVNDVFHPQEPAGETIAERILSGEKTVKETVRHTKAGQAVPVTVKGGPVYINGEIKGGYAVYVDISERKAYEEHLKHLSLYDQLTGLYNRNFFETEIKIIEKSKNYPVSIIAFDVDGLKLVNDTLGHAQGDALLQVVGDLISKSLRGTDILARVGGDEFVAVLPWTDQATGEGIVRRIRANIARANQEKRPFLISVSMGVATSENQADPLQEALKRADEKMYHEKLIEKKSYRGEMIATLLDALAELKEPD